MIILTIIGARPQFIKAAVVSRALASKGVSEMLFHIGQHYDTNMSDVFGSVPFPVEIDFSANMIIGGTTARY